VSYQVRIYLFDPDIGVHLDMLCFGKFLVRKDINLMTTHQ